MPISPAEIRSSLSNALANDILSERETTRLLDAVRDQGGLDAAGAQELVTVLSEALRTDEIDLSTDTRQRNLTHLLSTLNEQVALPLPRREGETDLLAALRRAARTTVLPQPTFNGTRVSVTPEGQLAIDNRVVGLELTPPSAEMIDALWGLNKPELLRGLPEPQQQALAANLMAAIEANLAVEQEGPDKHDRHVALTAAFGALAELAPSWREEICTTMLAHAPEARNPMMSALIHRGLAAAPLTDDQRATLAGREVPEAETELLGLFDDVRAGRARVGFYDRIEGRAAQFALNALTFSKNAAAFENVTKGMEAWQELDSGRGWSDEAVDRMQEVLKTYVETYDVVKYSYGIFKSDAPREVATVTNARAVAAARPELEADPPTLRDYPLTREQADFVLGLLENVRDHAAVNEMVKCLDLAASAYRSRAPYRYGSPSADAPMPPAAFELFRAAAQRYHGTAEGTEDGRLGYDDLYGQLSGPVDELRGDLHPLVESLAGTPPTWGDVELDEPAATYLRELLDTRIRSRLSVQNLSRAVSVIGAAHDGKIDGDTSAQLRTIVDGYLTEFPGVQYLAFNKLDRVADYALRGETLPPIRVNGEEVRLGAYVDHVATTVAGAMDPEKLYRPWLAGRWGFRARLAAERVDAVAEQTARGEGPVTILRERYPDATIRVQASARAGAHEQLCYEVTRPGQSILRFTQASDGTVAPYRSSVSPVTFTATIGADGELSVTVPEEISSTFYPLQEAYNVGDSIDYGFYDAAAGEDWDEGEPFSTRHKILEAEIVSYTADGQYTIAYTEPDGTERTREVPLSTIRKYNNPHFYRISANRLNYASDVYMDLRSDEDLAKFLDDAQPIIDRHLPPGAIATMTPDELTEAQKACIKDLMAYGRDHLEYPDELDESPDDQDRRYHELQATPNRIPLGALVEIKRGVCRHQCIIEHLLLQRAGIDSRLASGAANEYDGDYRGLHIWVEVTLANGERFLSDQTWDDPYVPLWDGAYDTDKERIEMYHRTARFDSVMVD